MTYDAYQENLSLYIALIGNSLLPALATSANNPNQLDRQQQQIIRERQRQQQFQQQMQPEVNIHLLLGEL